MKVLVVDDNPAVCTALEVLFDVHGLEALVARKPSEALDLVAREDVGVVVQDMNFQRDTTSGVEGIALMRAIRSLDPDVPILLMTAYTSLETAVMLIKEGASDYIAKPWNDEKLVATVKNLVKLRELSQERVRFAARTARARKELADRYDLRGLVYVSPEMHEVVSLAVRVAAADVPVFVTGPNGAGKERIAEIVQANSRRHSAPFVKVNAGGLPDQLLEAELFGAEAGAFTGATKMRVGRFEEASGGTLFLDEIGNLSPAGQMKLLRVLQTGEFQRLGSNVTRRADIRLVCATNADLGRMIGEGTFREDLLFRINVIELRVPSLRDRPEDALLLAEHFLEARAPGQRFGEEARRAISEHDWPGNVRELENRVQRAALVRTSGPISNEDLGLGAQATTVARTSSAARVAPSAATALDEVRLPPLSPVPDPSQLGPADRAERAEVERALAEAGGVVSRAAAMLGLSRQALYRKMDRLGITLERRVRDLP
ncbi:MAG: Histidine kinase/response regulator hybrid protein [Labilithrix sp.]|nr:Histidine kinase/response regulator hybrid protein [Labilithrix sp.]